MVSPDADDEPAPARNGARPSAARLVAPAKTSVRRNIADLEHETILFAIRQVFAANGALDVTEAVRTVAHTLDLARTGLRISKVIRAHLTLAVRRRSLTSERGVYALACRDIGGYSNDELIDALFGAMGGGWTEQADAIRAAARWLGFQRTGDAIKAAFKAAIKVARRRGWLERQGSQIRKLR
jgi:hypothetical protein